MKIINTPIVDCYKITPKCFTDDRGSFQELFNGKLQETIGDFNIKQTNVSESDKGVLRGLHFQTGKHSQAKLISVLRGQVLDVVVDSRVNSPTYGKVATFILSSELEKESLFVPKGCAHGFIALRNETVFMYQCDEYYNKESESGIVWDDRTLNIDWMLNGDNFYISEKDMELPSWEESYKFNNE
jgi:dTDP-4-dehydrorhamnose 3,5-epimerase